jgi:hypothetical protein
VDLAAIASEPEREIRADKAGRAGHKGALHLFER